MFANCGKDRAKIGDKIVEIVNEWELAKSTDAKGAKARDDEQQKQILKYVVDNIGLEKFNAKINAKLLQGCKSQLLNVSQANMFMPGVFNIRKGLNFEKERIPDMHVKWNHIVNGHAVFCLFF